MSEWVPPFGPQSAFHYAFGSLAFSGKFASADQRPQINSRCQAPGLGVGCSEVVSGSYYPSARTN